MILVQSVVPPGEFANSQLAVLHKFGAYLLRFDFDVGGGWLPDEIDRGWNNLLFFLFFLKKNLIIIICLLQDEG